MGGSSSNQQVKPKTNHRGLHPKSSDPKELRQLVNEDIDSLNHHFTNAFFTTNFEINNMRGTDKTNLLMEYFRRAEEIKHKTVGSILNYGIDVNAVDKYKSTALMWCLRYKPPLNIVQLLVKQGARVNPQNEGGNTALLEAVRYLAPTNVINFLITSKAKVNHANSSGDTALIMAMRYKATADVIKLLIRSGAHVEHVNKAGDSAMIWALKQNAPTDLINLLVTKGALGAAQQQQRSKSQAAAPAQTQGLQRQQTTNKSSAL